MGWLGWLKGSCRLYQAFDIARNLLQGCSCLLQLLKGCSGFNTPPEQQTEHLCRAGRAYRLCSQEQSETTFVCYMSAFVQQNMLQNIGSKVAFLNICHPPCCSTPMFPGAMISPVWPTWCILRCRGSVLQAARDLQPHLYWKKKRTACAVRRHNGSLYTQKQPEVIYWDFLLKHVLRNSINASTSAVRTDHQLQMHHLIAEDGGF